MPQPSDRITTARQRSRLNIISLIIADVQIFHNFLYLLSGCPGADIDPAGNISGIQKLSAFRQDDPLFTV
jgi:hypothetical protein